MLFDVPDQNLHIRIGNSTYNSTFKRLICLAQVSIDGFQNQIDVYTLISGLEQR